MRGARSQKGTTMVTTTTKAVQAYREAVAAVDGAISASRKNAKANKAFFGRVAREQEPLLEAMKLFLEGRDPEQTGMEIVRVSQSLRRFRESTYTSFMSQQKYLREKYYLEGVAAMVVVGGESLGRGLPNKTA